MSFSGYFAIEKTGTAECLQLFMIVLYRMVKYKMKEGKEDVYDGH